MTQTSTHSGHIFPLWAICCLKQGTQPEKGPASQIGSFLPRPQRSSMVQTIISYSKDPPVVVRDRGSRGASSAEAVQSQRGQHLQASVEDPGERPPTHPPTHRGGSSARTHPHPPGGIPNSKTAWSGGRLCMSLMERPPPPPPPPPRSIAAIRGRFEASRQLMQ